MAEEAALMDSKVIVDCIGPLEQMTKEIEALSKQLPGEQEFYFMSNFPDFKNPVTRINARSRELLSTLGTCEALRTEVAGFPADPDESYDWLVGVQDDVMEGVGSALDALGVGPGKGPREFLLDKPRGNGKRAERNGGAKVARKRNPIPFHVKSISRPQDKFDYPVDNSNNPFMHLSREALLGLPCKPAASAIESHARALGLLDTSLEHPLKEDLNNLKFADTFDQDWKPVKPQKLSQTPFTFVETLSALKSMAAKLAASTEFAVDLEHHHYRSFQGFVCLMQISTRSEDFVVDTLTLREHVGPALRKVFADPSVVKVIHGSDHDIHWLQRDFKIYVCNMFDTGQAARVLRMERFGLAYLLQTFCDVQPDKRYQLADWRLRPLTAEMLRYAREDTHYLLYVFDKLKEMLRDGQTTDELYVEVCKRSRDLCLQLHQKDIYVEGSYQQLHGIKEKNFQPEQLAIAAKLHAWRDKFCRQEDESTGYVLPNNLLLKIAEQAPSDLKALEEVLKGGHPVAAFHTAEILNMIREAKATTPAQVPNTDVQHEVPKVGEITVEKRSLQASIKASVAEKAVVVPRATSSMFMAMTGGASAASASKDVKEKKLQVSSTVAVVKRSAIADALFKTSKVSSEDEIKAKLASVRASFVLPFHSLKAAVPEFEEEPFEVPASAEQTQEDKVSTAEESSVTHVLVNQMNGQDNSSGACIAAPQTNTQETEVKGKRKRNDDDDDELPLSLNERYNKKSQTQHEQREPRHKEKRETRPKPPAMAASEVKSKPNFVPVKTFDPVKMVQEPDGLQRGKKRQVFPRTGSRSGTFK